ncbi:MAG TPA: ABC transporter permease [Bradyrhizobium sp.]|nr:ABC transporter permease [Bradyrhizobium sp.]
MIVGAILLFLVLPVCIVIPESFSDSKYLAFPPPGYSMKWYSAFLTSDDWLASTRASLVAAVLTMVFATPIGVASAYAINDLGPRFQRISMVFILLPMIVPSMLIAIGIFYVYIRLSLVNTMLGIVIAHSILAIPFVIVTVLSALRSFDLRQELVARSLGAPRFAAFRQVTLPQIRPAVISAALFAFIISLDEVIVSLFVAGGNNMVLTRRMFVALRDALDPTIAAISTFFIIVSLLVLGSVALLSRKR